MQYYDVFSFVYERGTELQWGKRRLEALELLRLQPGHTVLDVPTGTGVNLPHLIERIGPSGQVCGVDFSAGMLARARSKVRKAGWDNVTLIEADARTLTPKLVGRDQFDAGICVLGLTVVPDWAKVFQRLYDLVRPGGRVVVMDLYLAGKRSSAVFNGWYHMVARADSQRRFWEPLEQQAEDFQILDHRWPGGVVRIAAGTKPTSTVDLRRPTGAGSAQSVWGAGPVTDAVESA